MTSTGPNQSTIGALLSAKALTDDVVSRARAFERWWKERAPDLPLGEELTLAYLVDHPDWRATAATKAASSLARYYRDTAGVEIGGDLLRRYLTHRRRARGPALALVEPLRVEDAREIAEALDNESVPRSREPATVRALREGLALLRCTAPENQSLMAAWASVSALALQQSGESAWLSDPQGALVSRLDTGRAEEWRTHLAVLNRREAVLGRVANAMQRAGLAETVRVAALTDADWDWLWRMLDPALPRLLRDRAYMLVGLAHARRHAELRRLDIEDLVERESGFDMTYFDGKSRRELHRTLGHAAGDAGRCSPECPSCALSDLLRWERECMSRTSGPVFATRYRGEVLRMTRQNARLRIRAMTAAVADSPWGSTRSLRAGAATTAWEAHWSLERIATDLTGHGSVDQVRHYIRNSGSPAGTLQVMLEGPST